MSKMGYDAATLGNHDFDNGLDGLQKMLPHAKFPFVNANYDFSQTQLANQFGGIRKCAVAESPMLITPRWSEPLQYISS